MQHLPTTWHEQMNDEKNKRSTHRLLKRLRIALIVWLISFVATVIWFTYTR